MNSTLYNQIKQLGNWLIPPTCAFCKAPLISPQSHYCIACQDNLPYLSNCCARCGQTFSGFNDHCGKCLNTPPSFDLCFCPFEYASPISDEICQLKYTDRPQIASRLARLFIDELHQHAISRPEALISVPMHNSRLRARGFNQSTQLAKHISKALKLPLISNILTKRQATPRQTTQTLKQRKTNLNNSFEVKQAAPYKSVAIIDDVITTGATAEEISKILKRNGVNYIQVWGIAHTL